MIVLSLQTPRTRVKITGGSLIASFSESQPPTVWKLDLKKNHSFAVTLLEREGKWVIGTNSGKDEFTPMVLFNHREDAAEAYEHIQKAMMRTPWVPVRGYWKLVVGLIVLLGLFYVLSNVFTGSGSAPEIVPGVAQAPIVKHGVPQSADEILQPPSP